MSRAQLNTRIDESIAAQLRSTAEKEGVSQRAILESALKAYFQRTEPTDTQSQIDKVAGAVFELDAQVNFAMRAVAERLDAIEARLPRKTKSKGFR